MNNVYKNLDKMFDLLLDKETYSKYGINKCSNYWKIGSPIFETFDRLFEKIENLDISYPIEILLIENDKTTEGNNDFYEFRLKGINVTPCRQRHGKWRTAASSIHQYVSMLNAFGLAYDVDDFHNKKVDFVKSQRKLKLAANIKELLKKSNKLNLIIQTIVHAFFSNISDLRNIAYSILIEILIAYNFDFKNLSEKNQIFHSQKSNCKTKKYYSLVHELNAIVSSIKIQGTKNTYKSIIKTIKENFKSLEEIISLIWNEYNKHLDFSYETKETIIENINDLNFENIINNEYAKFKNNIFNDRKSKGLINNKSDFYSDILTIDNDSKGLLSSFNESNACHIMEFKKIKLLLSLKKYEDEREKEELKSFISNPNNGLMMNIEYHKSFDRGQWTFDANGEMLVNKENEYYLFELKGLKRIKINPKVFNEEMKKFLMKR